MVSTSHKICFGLILIALTVFFAAYYHSQHIDDSVYGLAQLMAGVTSLLSTQETIAGPELKSGHGFTEYRAVLILFAVAAVLSLLALFLNGWHRVRRGYSGLFMPMTFASLAALGCILYVGYQIGLHHYV